MATYRAVVDGNWSNLATWQDNSGGTYVASTVLPGVADDVYPNNFTVTIDQTISVKSLRNNTITGQVTAGGRFDMASSYNISTVDGIFGRTITTGVANVITDATVHIIGVVNITVNSNITGGAATGRCGFTVADAGVGSTIVINGNVTGGAGTSAYGFWANPQVNLTVNGDIIGGGSSGFGVRLTGLNSNLTVLGDVFAANSTASHGVIITQGGTGVVSITGDLRGSGGTGTGNALNIISNGTINILGHILSAQSTAVGAHTILIGVGSPTITITGNIEGGAGNAGTNGLNIVSTNSGLVTVNGNISAQTGAGVNNLSSNTQMFITGNIIASSASPAIVNLSLLTIAGTLTNVLSYMAVQSPRMLYNTTSSSFWTFIKGDNVTSTTLYTPGVDLGNPAITDVRDGVNYANGTLTGTLKVPSPLNVALGVPTDNTVGSAVITITDLGALLASYNI